MEGIVGSSGSERKTNMELSTPSPNPIVDTVPVLKRTRESGTSISINWRRIREWSTIILLAVASYLFISHFIFQMVEVQGQSMYPTLHNSDEFLLNRWAFFFHEPQRGTVVVLKDPSDGGYIVKRIVALPGEAVYLHNGKVYINGSRLNEPYLVPGTPTYPPADEKSELIQCGNNQYFVLGDNRNDSLDSRYFGPVQRRDILGTIF